MSVITFLNRLLGRGALGCVFTVLNVLGRVAGYLNPLHHGFQFAANFVGLANRGGGLLHEPANPTALAAAIRTLLLDPEQADMLGKSGQQAIHQRYRAAGMAQKTVELYRSLISDTGPEPLR